MLLWLYKDNDFILKRQIGDCEVFHNPFYCGKIRHNLLGDRIVQGNHPPIVDEEIWNKVNGRETHSGYTHSKEPSLFPLNKHITCPECGRHLTGYTVKGQQYYKCSHKGCRLNISGSVLHSNYRHILRGYTVPPELMPVVENIIQDILKERVEYQANEVKELKTRLTNAEKERKEVMIRYGKGKIQDDVYNTTIAEINQDITDITIELEKEGSKKSNLENASHDVALTACNLEDLWAYGTFDNRQKIQNLVFPEGLTWDREKLENLTEVENETFKLIYSISVGYENWYN